MDKKKLEMCVEVGKLVKSIQKHDEARFYYEGRVEGEKDSIDEELGRLNNLLVSSGGKPLTLEEVLSVKK